ncbi:ALF repeat-containing protein [Streptomyces althioticus]|uniref:ALF repeat-containing protein n=1 Tax=Streptomyces althioticus TaxID=83380 RepID=UPI003873CA9E|nr:ALF repeat-containing protein [Streptomyces althioticus]
MRQHRAFLLVAATALAPALLLPTPAFAGPSSAPATATTVAVSSETPVDEMTEDELRAAITAILEAEATGRGVTEAATRALDGTVDDMRDFLKTGHRLAQAHDDRFAMLVILGKARENGDRRVIQEINDLLDRDVPEEFREWLETGYPAAQALDDHVRLFRLLNTAEQNGDQRVRSEIIALLERNVPADTRAWLETGYPAAQAEDDRFALFVLLGTAQKAGDTKLVQEINGLLDRMDADEIRAWLTAYRAA